jgi:hypothetical protein
VTRAHDVLVARLVRDVTPVRPLWSPSVRLALWLAIATVPLAFALAFGLRNDLADQLRHPSFVLEVAALLAAGAGAAALALRSAVPGQEASARVVTASILLVGAALLLVLHEPASTEVPAARFAASGAQCVACILAFALLPWATLLVALRRGAPLEPAAAGAWAGAAAFLVSVAAVRIACPIDERWHLLAFHALPVAAGAGLSALAGFIWLDRWRARASSATGG